MDIERIALLITRIYGATFLALAGGWLLMALSASAIRSASISTLMPRFVESASAFLTQACVYLVAGAAITGLARRITKFAVQP